MDENKLAKLKEIGYKIHRCCGLCEHGSFRSGSMWGTCCDHTYEHKKHTNSGRQLSINRFGYCQHFKLIDTLDLDKFRLFLE